MAITLEGVQLIDVRKCDYNVSPSIRISFKEVIGEDPSTGFFEHREIKLRIDQPLDIFKKLSFDNIYRLQILESKSEALAQLSRINILKQHRVFTILRIDLLDDDTCGATPKGVDTCGATPKGVDTCGATPNEVDALAHLHRDDSLPATLCVDTCGTTPKGVDTCGDEVTTLSRQLDDDYPFPFEADKHSICTNLMCEIDRRKKELKCKIGSITQHLTDQRVELNKLENIEERLKNNSHSVTVLEQTYNQLNQVE